MNEEPNEKKILEEMHDAEPNEMPIAPYRDNGCAAGCLSVFAIFMVFVIVIYYGMTDSPNEWWNTYPPLADPKVSHGEFPFKLEYEIEGETFTIEDTMIFDYLGWKEGVTSNVRVWGRTYASGVERIVLLKVEDPVDMGRDVQIKKQMVCFSTGYGSYYMEGPHAEKIDPSYVGHYPYIFTEYEDGDVDERRCYAPDLYENFNIIIISWEAAEPIENS